MELSVEINDKLDRMSHDITSLTECVHCYIGKQEEICKSHKAQIESYIKKTYDLEEKTEELGKVQQEHVFAIGFGKTIIKYIAPIIIGLLVTGFSSWIYMSQKKIDAIMSTGELRTRIESSADMHNTKIEMKTEKLTNTNGLHFYKKDELPNDWTY